MTPHDEAETREILKQARRQLCGVMGTVDAFDTRVMEIFEAGHRLVSRGPAAVRAEMGDEAFDALVEAVACYATLKACQAGLDWVEGQTLERLGEVDVDED